MVSLARDNYAIYDSVFVSLNRRPIRHRPAQNDVTATTHIATGNTRWNSFTTPQVANTPLVVPW